MTGVPPGYLDGSASTRIWQYDDLVICSWYQRIIQDTCPGCGRPAMQHLKSDDTGREETKEDYIPMVYTCPSEEALAIAQQEWSTLHKHDIERFHSGRGADPSKGIYWLTKHKTEVQ